MLKVRNNFTYNKNTLLPLFSAEIAYFVLMKHRAIVLLLLLPFSSLAQMGGNTAYKFLNLPFSARVASIGGTAISICDNDVNLAVLNPSLLNPTMHNHIGMSYVNYFSDINYGYATYARKFDKIGTFSAGAQFVNYGKFLMTDNTGAVTGEFKAADEAFNISYGRQIDSMFSVGASMKFVYSALESYYSSGMAFDVAATYNNSARFFSAALVLKNIGGFQIKKYTTDNKEPFPYEIQFGISKKPKHMPFRFTFTGQHLQKWDLTYEDPNNPTPTVDPLTNEPIKQNKAKIFGDKLMRHVVVGGELLLTKNFNLRIGYNYMRRKDLAVDTRKGTVGFCWGFGFRIYKFHLSYGRAAYHLAGPSNHFTLGLSLADFYSKK